MENNNINLGKNVFFLDNKTALFEAKAKQKLESATVNGATVSGIYLIKRRTIY